MRFVAALVVALAVGAGCAAGPDLDQELTRPPSRPEGARTSAPMPELRSVPRTKAEVIVQIEAPRRGERRVNRAIANLEVIGLWKRLTAELAGLTVEVAATVPPDRHLAEAAGRDAVGYEGLRRFCRVTLFSQAIRYDLDRQGYWHRVGRVAAPPTAPDFWAALLAHELAHCLPGRHGERVAVGWEQRTLRRLGKI